MPQSVTNRLAFTTSLAQRAGAAGMVHFRSLESLTIESKGHQDMVSNADRELETMIRAALANAYPDDGIIGEEYPPVTGRSGFTWIIDPIDGTANFVSGIPAWCVVIACVDADGGLVGVTYEPSNGETFAAGRGLGATLNGKSISVSSSQSLADGSMGIGFSNRVGAGPVLPLLKSLTDDGGVFYRNASGALMLAYVAAGRLIGYAEQHMNSWDCVAGILQIKEAGGNVYPVAPVEMLRAGGPVVAACPGVYNRAEALAMDAFSLEREPGL